MNADACLDELLPWVNRAVVDVLLRRRRDRDFAEDFRGWVVLKMLERNGAKLRCFRGESTLLTYLRVVVDRLYCDYLNALNGKWHPSKKAAELGSKTVELERLVYRDGFTLDQAVALMQVRDGGVSDSDLRAGFAKIPIRQKRSFVALDSVPELCADAGSSADAILWRREIEDQGIRLRGSLARALSELPEQDRYILDLRFVQGLRVSWISRLSGLSQRALTLDSVRYCEYSGRSWRREEWVEPASRRCCKRSFPLARMRSPIDMAQHFASPTRFRRTVRRAREPGKNRARSVYKRDGVAALRSAVRADDRKHRAPARGVMQQRSTW